MKRLALMLCFFTALPVTVYASFFDDDTPNPCTSAAAATFETAFSSPKAPLSPTIVKELTSAKKSIYVVARDFMSKPVSEALFKAARDGHVDLKVVLNKKNNQSVYSASQFLLTMSHPARLTKSDDALHSDYIIVDDRDVIVGNVAAFVDEDEEKKNAASALIIHNAPDLAKQYLANWQTLWDASVEMEWHRDKN